MDKLLEQLLAVQQTVLQQALELNSMISAVLKSDQQLNSARISKMIVDLSIVETALTNAIKGAGK